MFQRLWRLLRLSVGFRETRELAVARYGSCDTAVKAAPALPTAEPAPLPPVTAETLLVVEATGLGGLAVDPGHVVEPLRKPEAGAACTDVPSNVVALFATSLPDRRLAARGLAVARLNPPKSRARKKSAIASTTKPIVKRPGQPSSLKPRRDMAAPRVLPKRVRTADVIRFAGAAPSERRDGREFGAVASVG
jgi:hypothetical protein